MRSLPHKTIASAKRSCVPNSINPPARAIEYTHIIRRRTWSATIMLIPGSLSRALASWPRATHTESIRGALQWRAKRERTSRSARDDVPPPIPALPHALPQALPQLTVHVAMDSTLYRDQVLAAAHQIWKLPNKEAAK